MKSSRGFTVIELIVIIVILLAASALFFIQRNHVEVAARDEARKTSINAMYYALEEVYFKEHQSYPQTIDSKILYSVDPELFKDTNGVKVGESESEFRYEPLNCTDSRCKSYTLRTILENEDDYIKKSRNN